MLYLSFESYKIKKPILKFLSWKVSADRTRWLKSYHVGWHRPWGRFKLSIPSGPEKPVQCIFVIASFLAKVKTILSGFCTGLLVCTVSDINCISLTH